MKTPHKYKKSNVQAPLPNTQKIPSPPIPLLIIYIEHSRRIHRSVTQTSMFGIKYLRTVSSVSNQG